MPQKIRTAAVSSVTVALHQAFKDSSRAETTAYVYRIECEEDHQYFFGTTDHPVKVEKMSIDEMRAMIPKQRRPKWIVCVANVNANENNKPEDAR